MNDIRSTPIHLDGQMNLVNEQRLEAYTSGIGGSLWKADEGADVRETSLGSYRDDTGGDLEDEDRQGCRNLSFPALLCSPDSSLSLEANVGDDDGELLRQRTWLVTGCWRNLVCRS